MYASSNCQFIDIINASKAPPKNYDMLFAVEVKTVSIQELAPGFRILEIRNLSRLIPRTDTPEDFNCTPLSL